MARVQEVNEGDALAANDARRRLLSRVAVGIGFESRQFGTAEELHDFIQAGSVRDAAQQELFEIQIQQMRELLRQIQDNGGRVPQVVNGLPNG
jgi:hypothetical protein